jgi:predicted transcriptional regulator
MGRYRDRLQIIADILAVVKDGARKTHVMYQANLSFALLRKYLVEVLDAGLVSVDSEDYYKVTRRGQDFLDKFHQYTKRCDQIEEQLNHVNDEKNMLENLIVDNLKRRSKGRMQKKKNA